MNTIAVTDAERRSGGLTPEHLNTAVQAIQNDGYVVLEDIVDLGHIAILRDKMISDTTAYLARPDAPFNFNKSNIQQEAPPDLQYLFRDVLVNDMVIQVTKSLLGAGVKNSFYSGNTAVPRSTQRQPAHADVGQLWPGLKEATPPFGLVVNVPVVDMTPENGSTEIWPGTHLDTSVAVQAGDIKVSEEKLEQRRAQVPPFQPSVRAGSVVIRDIRMWHAGMPNTTDTPRPMIAMIHWVSWWNEQDFPSFPRSAQSFFEHPDLRTVANWVDDPIDYLSHGGAYDFQPEAALAIPSGA